MKITIKYDGGLNEKLEKKIIAFLKKEGFVDVASGFYVKTQTRDIEFDREDK